MRRVALAIALAAIAVTIVPAVRGQGEVLTGLVGPGFTISLKRGTVGVTQLDPGAYTVQVNDMGDIHTFHLRGPGGVDQKTGVEETGEVSWNVSLVNGTYTYLCDVHPTSMRKTFRVGPPVVLPKLYGAVGPGLTITLGTKVGKKTARVKAGTYSVIVRDRSKKENFHLSGPGVNRKTGKAFTGSVTWKVTFKKGRVYLYFSDAHPSLVKDFIKTT